MGTPKLRPWAIFTAIGSTAPDRLDPEGRVPGSPIRFRHIAVVAGDARY